MEQSKYLSEDTIHALATPLGGALAVIRISGPKALEVYHHLRGETGRLTASPRKMHRFKIFSVKGTLLDDAMGVVFLAPQTQTGEDLVELFIHGGTWTAEKVLDELVCLGSRQALPGEFSFRAVRNGKTTISQARAVADLIAASNEGAARLALEKMEGSQSRLVVELAERLRKLATQAELGIDFSDQEIEELSLPTLKKEVFEVLHILHNLEDSFDRGEKIQFGIRTAFIGRPNAGKSSFFNALLGEERSIVSDIPGTTRDLVRERITLRSEESTVTLRIEDTAGIRSETKDLIERAGIERSVRAAREADLVILILDGDSAEVSWVETKAFLDGIVLKTEKIFVVLTKRDRLKSDYIEKISALIQNDGYLWVGAVSSTTGEGLSDAVRKIAAFAHSLTSRIPGEVLLTRLDELRSVKETVTHLERALKASEEDLFAADLRQALISLGPVIGETLPDDILGRIFSEFCIGK